MKEGNLEVKSTMGQERNTFNPGSRIKSWLCKKSHRSQVYKVPFGLWLTRKFPDILCLFSPCPTTKAAWNLIHFSLCDFTFLYLHSLPLAQDLCLWCFLTHQLDLQSYLIDPPCVSFGHLSWGSEQSQSLITVGVGVGMWGQKNKILHCWGSF